MNDITILLTGTGAPGAPGIIKCLRNNGERVIKIIGVDMNPECGSKNMVDKFYVVPAAEDLGFIDRIKEICIKENVELVLPIVTKELEKFSKSKNDFNKLGIKVSVMDEEKLEISNDKGKLLNKLRDSNIPLPIFYLCKNIEQIKLAFNKLNYPKEAVCIKITKGNGSRGIRIVDPNISKYNLFLHSKPTSLHISYDELFSTLMEREVLDEMMVMEYLPGEEYSVDLLVNQGEVIHVVGRYNSVVSSSIPLGCKLEYREDAIKQAIEICEYLKLDGNIGIDFKYNNKNDPRLMEINPRLTATIVVPAIAGINFPYLGIKKLLNEDFEISEVEYGIKMVRRWEEIYEDKDGKSLNW